MSNAEFYNETAYLQDAINQKARQLKIMQGHIEVVSEARRLIDSWPKDDSNWYVRSLRHAIEALDTPIE